MPTKRQIIIKLLSNGSYTLQELSSEIHLSMREVLDHLEHARKSVRSPKKFIIEPAECLNCGFIFKDRSKVHTPGKCPKCRSSHIHEPSYRIEWIYYWRRAWRKGYFKRQLTDREFNKFYFQPKHSSWHSWQRAEISYSRRVAASLKSPTSRPHIIQVELDFAMA